MQYKISDMLYKTSYTGYDILFSKDDISFIQLNKVSKLVCQVSIAINILFN